MVDMLSEGEPEGGCSKLICWIGLDGDRESVFQVEMHGYVQEMLYDYYYYFLGCKLKLARRALPLWGFQPLT